MGQLNTHMTAVQDAERTVDEYLELARDVRHKLRAEQELSDALGTYSPAMHAWFKDHGFYRLLQPKRYAGHEMSLADFYRVMIEISRGHPALGWNLTLGAAHSLTFAAHWPKDVQDEVFGADGHFVAPHRAFPGGRCQRVEGGYRVSGTFNYCTGVTYSTHVIVTVRDADAGPDAPPLNCLIPRADYTLLDDWGGDKVLGMRASGSNSICVDEAFVPERWVTPFSAFFANQDVSQGTHGTRLHGNPLYLGYLMLPYHANLLAPIIGAARAALDEYRELILKLPLPFAPNRKRAEDPNYQRAYGQALTLTDAAEATLLQICDNHSRLARRWSHTREPISVEQNVRAWGALQQAGRQACEAIELLFRTAGTSQARSDARLLRYFSDAAMYRGHVGAQWETFSTYVARAELGLPLDFLQL
ncbi:hypothetical protein BFW87_01485 [Pseudomonas fluorescens]|uniref:Acyl-CoA dehydrogenase C-terminal domain-containing protein n=1 Tax=Pseudomonas fluorescens TaxID=294 RepID=A0A1T2Z741_PSEFL|nr:hypothetical protein [Pseudomonas fluorescens]OPB00395.1 hypothetical protein BFW87_01485 [Pseudomonas fluorescens]